MKKLLLSIMLLSAIPLAAQASCETVKADISQKLSKWCARVWLYA